MHLDLVHAPRQRSGFTLIELFVVLGIILSLSVLTVLFMPRIQERQRVAQGADLLQGWVLNAKQRAMRDHRATGLRLQRSANSNYVRDLQYVQQPDDYAPPGRLMSWTPTPVSLCTFDAAVNLLGSAASDQDEASLVHAGDYLQLQGGGLTHQIISPPPIKANQCALASGLLPANVSLPPGGATFRIKRQPRLLAGEQPLQLPQDVAIDLSVNPKRSLNVPARQQPGSQLVYSEILFSPGGGVVGQGTGNAPIALWVRDVTLNDPNAPGDQTLIVIYPRTGLIAAHPVAQGGDPYQFIRDGRSSGF
jgi:prepilin-type N-terminal cleavage/methylation domain-containing protein